MDRLGGRLFLLSSRFHRYLLTFFTAFFHASPACSALAQMTWFPLSGLDNPQPAVSTVQDANRACRPAEPVHLVGSRSMVIHNPSPFAAAGTGYHLLEDRGVPEAVHGGWRPRSHPRRPGPVRCAASARNLSPHSGNRPTLQDNGHGQIWLAGARLARTLPKQDQATPTCQAPVALAERFVDPLPVLTRNPNNRAAPNRWPASGTVSVGGGPGTDFLHSMQQGHGRSSHTEPAMQEPGKRIPTR